MDLKQLEALVGIDDHGSFSSAASALGTVQSNISGRIARLESELGTSLIDRGSGQLTQDGLIVVARARRVLGELESMMADVLSAHSEVSGTVRVGMIGTTGRWLIPQIFAQVRERYPRIVLRVTEGTTTTLEPQLLQGQLDFAVLTLPVQAPELAVLPLFEEKLVLVVPADHPLALRFEPGDDDLPLDALEDLDMLLPLPGTALREELDVALAPRRITPRSSIELDGLRTLASLVFDGYGPAILPATAVPAHLRDRFRLLPLAGLPPRRVGLVARRHGLPSAPSRAVRELLVEAVKADDALPEGITALSA
jgi:LysR family hydrogen peroxide-inducible transcriptional activator